MKKIIAALAVLAAMTMAFVSCGLADGSSVSLAGKPAKALSVKVGQWGLEGNQAPIFAADNGWVPVKGEKIKLTAKIKADEDCTIIPALVDVSAAAGYWLEVVKADYGNGAIIATKGEETKIEKEFVIEESPKDTSKVMLVLNVKHGNWGDDFSGDDTMSIEFTEFKLEKVN